MLNGESPEEAICCSASRLAADRAAGLIDQRTSHGLSGEECLRQPAIGTAMYQWPDRAWAFSVDSEIYATGQPGSYGTLIDRLVITRWARVWMTNVPAPRGTFPLLRLGCPLGARTFDKTFKFLASSGMRVIEVVNDGLRNSRRTAGGATR
jgi:hypothetical protein